MFGFRRSFIALTVGLLAAGPALAADLAYKAPPREAAPVPVGWTGWYFGGNGGYATSYDKTGVAGDNAISQIILDIGALPGSLDTHQSGWFGGAQLGYNWQAGQLLFGLETDFQFGSVKGSDSQTITLTPIIPAPALGISAFANTEMEWFGTFRGRFGFLVSDRALIYATGGLAYGKVEHSAGATLTAPAPIGASAAASVSDTKVGYVIGGGIEYALLPSWTVKTEYLYMDLGSIGATYGTSVLGAPISYTSHTDLTYHVVRAGLNYRF